MGLTNNIRRLKKKIAVLETEGSKQVFEDLLRHLIEVRWKGETSPEELHKQFLAMYKSDLDKLIEQQGTCKQTEIGFNENY